MNMTETQKHVMDLVWKSDGYAFGGTARDMVRGVQPKDLDVRIGPAYTTYNQAMRDLGATEIHNPNQARGQEYYDRRLVFPDGTQVDIKYGFCSVTDCDINLLKLFKRSVELLYVPNHLIAHHSPLSEVLANICKNQFVPLQECEQHRRYRWLKFKQEGWRMLQNPLLENL